VPNEKREIKVTDKRMFTAAGELKEEYRFLDEKSTSPDTPEPSPPPPPPAQPSTVQAVLVDREPAPPASYSEPDRWALEPDPQPAGRPDFPETPPELGGPSFYDLVAMIAEPVPIYLGDARLPDGQLAIDLEMARLYIDLLEILRQKTAGNLDPQERAFLEDLLYRLRVRYVHKRG
jgi:hypothetical protein